MFSIAHAGVPSAAVKRLRLAFPLAELVGVPTVGGLHEAVTHSRVNAAIIGPACLSDRGLLGLSALKAKHPYLATVLYADLPERSIARISYLAGHAGCDALIVGGIDDHPSSIKEHLKTAGLRSIACTICAWSAPTPEVVTRLGLEAVLRQLRSTQRTGALAAAMGCTLGDLREQLRANRLFQPLLFLAWVKQLAAARLLADTSMTVERVGFEVGYSSGTAYHNGCHTLIGATPTQIRNLGGLRYAAAAYRAALGAARHGARRTDA